jgi:titin
LEALEDRWVPATLPPVTSAADSGNGTLRAAILAANRTTGGVTITFKIGAVGSSQTINLTSPLPAITASVFINGTSQGGPGYSGPPLIELNGTRAGSSTSGLDLVGSGIKIQGLFIDKFVQDGILLPEKARNDTIGGTAAGAGNVISNNGNHGIELVGSTVVNNLIVGNFIGTDKSGTLPSGNKQDGILIRNGSSGNTVGGTATGAGNVISANLNDGIEIVNVGTSKNLIQGNLIGTNLNGAGSLGNKFDGVLIRTGATLNTVGGTASGAGNVIGNGKNGIELVGLGTMNNLIQGNFIGVQSDGVTSLANSTEGIAVRDLAAQNTIGGIASAAGNVIAFSGGNGVLVGGYFNGSKNALLIGDDVASGESAGVGNAIEGNSIFGNQRLGIFLGADNTSRPPVVLVNNSKGHPNLDNRYQNYPVLSAPRVTASTTILSGTLNSPNNARTTLRIEFFANTSADPSGHGQGQTFLGATTVTTNASGNGSFSLTLKTRLPSGTVISATATDAHGDTSEFAKDVTVP